MAHNVNLAGYCSSKTLVAQSLATMTVYSVFMTNEVKKYTKI